MLCLHLDGPVTLQHVIGEHNGTKQLRDAIPNAVSDF